VVEALMEWLQRRLDPMRRARRVPARRPPDVIEAVTGS
jgi:hypothetical protein